MVIICKSIEISFAGVILFCAKNTFTLSSISDAMWLLYEKVLTSSGYRKIATLTTFAIASHGNTKPPRKERLCAK